MKRFVAGPSLSDRKVESGALAAASRSFTVRLCSHRNALARHSGDLRCSFITGCVTEPHKGLPGAWVPWLTLIVLIVPMASLALNTATEALLRIEAIVTALFLVIAAFGIIAELKILLSAMVGHSSAVTGLQLLTSSIAVWATNVLIFSVAYWRIDRGGPEARANHANRRPDWLFPQENAGENVPPDWRPTFVDYLFLAFCTATAFSPTDAQPLTSRTKLLMMLESTISLVTIVVVASRAINILGS
jgi:hypothetical protein